MEKNIKYVQGILRIALGWIFLWGFLDKLFGFGYGTAPADAWLNGGSPTTGFLKFATNGPLSSIFQAMAGYGFVDFLFMMGLMLIGIALIAGIAMKLATIGGIVMMSLMYIAVIPPEHNILIDEHVIYALVLLGLYFKKAGHEMGYGKKWEKCKLVKKYPCLK
jgi:thiosulfate dehydrogenase (quinone) large subunit